MKKLLILTVAGLFAAAWWSTLDTTVTEPAKYEAYLKEAQAYEEKGIYYDAILAYREALVYQPDSMSIYLKIADDYKKLEDFEEFENTCSSAISLGGDNETAIFTLADYYIESGQKQEAISLLKRQIEKKENNEALKEKLNTLAGGYQALSGEYESISVSCNGYMRVTYDEKYGMLDSEGHKVINPQYDAIGLFGTNGFAPVKDGENWYYIDTNNYKRRMPDEPYDSLGVVSQGILPAEKEGKWGYLNEDFQQVSELEYDGATPFLNGIAAVKKGEKWALINNEMEIFTDYVFDEVVTDEWGFCSRNEVVFVRSGEQYMLLDKEGKQLGTEVFEKASPFISSQPAAVMQGGKWGFVSVKGEIVMECHFQNAGSFSEIGYAPASDGDSWGYIGSSGDFILEPEFEQAKAFNSNGIAPVKQEGTWKLIQLDIY